MLSYSEDSLQFAPADYDVNKIGFILVDDSGEESAKINNSSTKSAKSRKPSTTAPSHNNFCHICQRAYMSSGNLRRHVKTMHENVYRCEKCNMEFTGINAESKFSSHNCAADPDADQNFDCDTCGHSADSRESLIWHLELHRKLDIEIDDIFA